VGYGRGQPISGFRAANVSMTMSVRAKIKIKNASAQNGGMKKILQVRRKLRGDDVEKNSNMGQMENNDKKPAANESDQRKVKADLCQHCTAWILGGAFKT